MELKVDPAREEPYGDATGIYVRARATDGSWGTFDFSQLDKDSMHAFAESRGPVSSWALGILDALLGYRDR